MNLRTAVLSAVLGVYPTLACAQTVSNLLVIYTDQSPASVQIAEYYAKVRQVPASHIVRIQTADSESITRANYESSIEAPIAAWLARHRLQDQVLYLVLTKGIPLRVTGTGGLSGTYSSVDSELTLLYRKMTGASVPVLGRVENPYFLGNRPIGEARGFSRLTSDLYLVTRLDGFTVEDVTRMIDRALSPAREGEVVLDQRAATGDRGGDIWLAEAAERLVTMNQGARVQLETTRAIASSTAPVLGYFSWGSNDPASPPRHLGHRFANGAIGGMFVSTDGRSFREPSPNWRPAPTGSTTGGQSLVGDLIRDGITGVAAQVAEPYLDAIVRPQILFPSYVSGFNLADSFYLAMPFLSWQNIVVGDPLCAPFLQKALAPEQLHEGIDAATELPSLFARRSLEVWKSANLKIEAVRVFLKAKSLQAQGRPEAEVVGLLTEATALEPRLTAAQMQLAEAATGRNDFDEALARHRAVLAVEPNNVFALNNLAYLLVDRKNAPKDALPYAERAYRLSEQSPAVGDTLGWIHFKLGHTSEALLYLDRAARQSPKELDILIHAATVHASLNSLPQARTYLEAALKLDPKAAEREDVKALAARIRK